MARLWLTYGYAALRYAMLCYTGFVGSAVARQHAGSAQQCPPISQSLRTARPNFPLSNAACPAGIWGGEGAVHPWAAPLVDT